MSESTIDKLSPNDKRPALIGKQFDRLTVIGVSDRKGYVICRCECGNTNEIRRDKLTSKLTRSCGCLRRELTASNKVNAINEVNTCYRTAFQIIEKTSPHKNNTSGKTGVSWDKRSGKWQAYIRIHYKQINLGYYTSLDEAIKARQIAEDKYHLPLIEAKNEEVVDV